MISLFAANGHLVFETTLKGENTARSQALAHHTDILQSVYDDVVEIPLGGGILSLG